MLKLLTHVPTAWVQAKASSDANVLSREVTSEAGVGALAFFSFDLRSIAGLSMPCTYLPYLVESIPVETLRELYSKTAGYG